MDMLYHVNLVLTLESPTIEELQEEFEVLRGSEVDLYR
jgi:hypothetical protein